MFPLQERDGFRLNLDDYVRFIRDRGSRVAVVCNVNNPDGCYLPRRDVIRFMETRPISKTKCWRFVEFIERAK